jgi:hypothetical protein
MGVARVNHQGHAHGLKAAPRELRPRSSCGGGQTGTHYVGEINPCFFEYCTLDQHPTATAATLGALPFVNNKPSAAVFRGELCAYLFLQLQKVGLNGIHLHK